MKKIIWNIKKCIVLPILWFYRQVIGIEMFVLVTRFNNEAISAVNFVIKGNKLLSELGSVSELRKRVKEL